MISLVTFFSVSILLGVLWYYFGRTRKEFVSTLILGEPDPDSYTVSGVKEIIPKYFHSSEGEVVNLRKHKELVLFHVLGGKDVLVEPWGRNNDLVLREGESMLAIFKILEDSSGRVVGIPCLRRFESLITDETGEVWNEYKQDNLGVTWKEGGHPEVLPSENLIGIVRYESI